MPYANIDEYREWCRARRADIRQIIDEAKQRPCADCGVQFPLPAMQFDHVKGVKRFDLARANGKPSSLQSVRDEIAKCEVVCANCHLIREDERSTGNHWHANR